MFIGLDVLEGLGTFPPFPFPHDTVYYFCRQTGKALTFITREDWRYARDLCDILQEASQARLANLIENCCIYT